MRPGEIAHLSFMYEGKVPDRFIADETGIISYTVRTRLKPLLETVLAMYTCHGVERLHISGPLGNGKSHDLMALHHALRDQGRVAVYIPDCYEMMAEEKAVYYILRAFKVAFANHEDRHLRRAMALITPITSSPEALENELYRFCRIAKSLKVTIYFLIDQANALDAHNSVVTYDRITAEKKRDAACFLDGITSNHLKISSSTAIYRGRIHDETRQTREVQVFYGEGWDDVRLRGASSYSGKDTDGLKDEMREWWHRYDMNLPDFPLSEEDKKYLEMWTGRNPLLLHLLQQTAEKLCAGSLATTDPNSPSKTPASQNVLDIASMSQKNAKSSKRFALPDNVSDVVSVPGQVATVRNAQLLINAAVMTPDVQRISKMVSGYISRFFDYRTEKKDLEACKRFARALQGCISEDMVNDYDASLLDGRFFYVQNGKGHCTSSFVRQIADKLSRDFLRIPSEWVEPRMIRRIGEKKLNRSVLGFAVEKAVIGLLSQGFEAFHGIGLPSKGPETQTFRSVPDTLSTEAKGNFLFVPVGSNYMAVDCIGVYMPEPKDKKTVPTIVGIQITISATHPDTEAAFLQNADTWRTIVNNSDAEFHFIWITPFESTNEETVEETTRASRSSGETVKQNAYTRRNINFADLSTELNAAYIEALKSVPATQKSPKGIKKPN